MVAFTLSEALVVSVIDLFVYPKTVMRIYLIDDRGKEGEYAGFLHAHKTSLPIFELEVFTHWAALLDAIHLQMPDVILADMRFDETPTAQLYGDIDALANSDRFCGNRERAEAQIRGMQGLMICKALRENHVQVPILLFASLAPQVAAHAIKTLSPLSIVEGLRLGAVRTFLTELC